MKKSLGRKTKKKAKLRRYKETKMGNKITEILFENYE